MATPTRLLALPRRTHSGDESGTRESSRNGKGQLVVEIPPAPRNYLLCPGVPLESPQIVLPRDTTAYIIERILLPPTKVSEHDGKPLPKRMTYIIGWHDLPAARRLVPAMEVLDFVSPRELEDWECRLEQELDDVREALEEDQRVGKALPKNKSKPSVTPIDPKTGKRRRGRPPAHTQIEPGAVVELEVEGDQSKTRLKGGALSLSTPKKNRLKDFEGLSDDDGSPSRQLEKELYEYDVGAARYEPSDVIEATDAKSEGGYRVGELHMEEAQPKEKAVENVITDDDSVPITKEPAPQPLALQSTPSAASMWAAFGVKNSFAAMGKSPAAASVGSSATLQGLTPHKTADAGLLSVQETEITTTPAKPEQPKADRKKAQKKQPSAKTTKKHKAPQSQPVDENGETVWVVKCLEDHDLFEVEGEKDPKRYFQVRWEGDWPEDQNPTWEPEENLPAHLVRNYLKAGKRRKKPRPSGEDTAKRKRLKQMTLPWMNSTQYTSVGEAFAGEHGTGDDAAQENVHMSQDLDPEEAEYDTGGGAEELFVVDEDADPLGETAMDWRGTSRRILGYG